MSDRHQRPGCFLTFILPLGGLLTALSGALFLLG